MAKKDTAKKTAPKSVDRSSTTESTSTDKTPDPVAIRIAPGQANIMPPVIAKAIIDIQKKIEPLTKSAENSEFNSSFVPLDVVMSKVLKLLGEHNLGHTQWPVSEGEKSYLVTVLFHENGSSITGEVELMTTRRDLQAVGSAITYARRYGLMSILGLVGENDDDGNKASGRQLKPTDEQIAEIRQLCIDLKFPHDQVNARIQSLRTQDQATVALSNLHDLISKRAKTLNGEATKPIPVFTGSRDASIQPNQGTTSISETRIDKLKSRLLNLELPTQVRQNFVYRQTGKPFMEKCSPEELDRLEQEIGKLEEHQRDGIAPAEETA